MSILLVQGLHLTPEPVAVGLVRAALDGRTRRGIFAVLRSLEPVARTAGYDDGPSVLAAALRTASTPLGVLYRPRYPGEPGAFPVVLWRGTRYEVIRGKLHWERLAA